MIATVTIHIELLQSPLLSVALAFLVTTFAIAVLKYLKRILF